MDSTKEPLLALLIHYIPDSLDDGPAVIHGFDGGFELFVIETAEIALTFEDASFADEVCWLSTL